MTKHVGTLLSIRSCWELLKKKILFEEGEGKSDLVFEEVAKGLALL
jgi:hypothetical protein